jgi:NAD(P)-dependent dehydrogenase (short-subunit alcohol dehydrogenase family)
MGNVGQKVAIVTGGSQGIGAGVVAAYRQRGWGVVATSRAIEASNDADLVTVAGDIADAETSERVVAAALERFGRIDTLVNNAGIFIAKPFTDYTDEDYRRATGINLDGFFHIAQRSVPHLLENDGGHLVSISTTLVEYADARIPSVLASLTKGGLTAATRSLAIEYATRGLRVNAVAPGIIKTPLHDPASYDQLATIQPIGRMGEVSDVVDAVLYLEDAPLVTGETLHVDGGQIAGH